MVDRRSDWRASKNVTPPVKTGNLTVHIHEGRSLRTSCMRSDRDLATDVGHDGLGVCVWFSFWTLREGLMWNS